MEKVLETEHFSSSVIQRLDERYYIATYVAKPYTYAYLKKDRYEVSNFVVAARISP